MDTINSFIKATLLGVALMLLLTSCPSVCPDAVYQFGVTAEFTTEKDSIQLGDTLYLSSSFPTKLTDMNSGKEVDYSRAVKIGTTVFIDELPSDKSGLVSAVNRFLYVSRKGRIYNDATIPSPSRVNQLTYQQLGNKYELQVAFIPQKKACFV